MNIVLFKNKQFTSSSAIRLIGKAIVSYDLHNQLCINHLNDTKIYHEPDYNPLNKTYKYKFIKNQLDWKIWKLM
jgi:hypothetical protein